MAPLPDWVPAVKGPVGHHQAAASPGRQIPKTTPPLFLFAIWQSLPTLGPDPFGSDSAAP